jgi:hypothetical protein
MKTEIRNALLLVGFTLISTFVYTQTKEIKVQIMHENNVVLDTTLYKSSDEAKVIIENLVQRFTVDPVSIDSKITHGLYVFNIKNDSWIDPTENSAEFKVEEPKLPKQPETTQKATIPEPKNSTAKIESEPKNTNIDDMDMDSLFREFSMELDTKWDEAKIDIVMDSVGSSFNQLLREIKKFDFETNPDLNNLKYDMKKIFDQIKTTQIIIIQNGDTLKTR